MWAEERVVLFSHGRLEITTTIGCRMACTYCPQKLLGKEYTSIERPLRMTLDTFRRCLEKIPSSVRIDFSGMSEPWQNPACTDMVLYAAERGHTLAVYSTLVGMTLEDVERIQHLPFEGFVIHLPDEHQNTKVPITPEYLAVFEKVVALFGAPDRHRVVGGSCHGPIHPAAKERLPENYFDPATSQGVNFRMIDRAGLLSHKELVHKRTTGPVMCKLCRKQLNHNVLLPDGSVVLCCMDYGLEYVLGNLLESDYLSLFDGPRYREIQDGLRAPDSNLRCRQCHNATAWTPGYLLHPLGQPLPLGASTELKWARQLAESYGATSVAEWKVEEPLGFESDELATTIPLIPDVRPHSRDAASMAGLKRLLEEVPVAIARIPASAGEAEAEGVEVRLRAAGIGVEFSGRIADDMGELGWAAVLTHPKKAVFEPAPSGFRVTALIAAYNEADVVRETISALIEQGVDVYFIDNWSNDGTFEIVEEFLGRGVVGLERFPAGAPSPTYDWTDLLRRKEELCRTLQSNWFIHFDADELRESPWPGVSLRDAFWRVDREGFTAVDHTVLDFRPVDGGAGPPATMLDFQWFELRAPLMARAQLKAWKNLGRPVDLATSGGHTIQFEGLRIYPYYFLLRHYPLRSQEQAARKVFAERKSRWNAEERARGWHFQYDNFREGHRFAWKAEDLIGFDATFYRDYLVERLSGIGIKSRLEQRALEKSLPRLSSRLEAANVSGEHLLAAFTNPEDPLSPAEFRILRMNIDRSRQLGEHDKATLLENLMLLAANSQRPPELEPAAAG